jgi:hypothetical protein
MTDEMPTTPRRPRRSAPVPPPDGLPEGAGPVASAEASATPAPQAASASTPSASQATPGARAYPETVLRVERGGIAEATAGRVDVTMGGIGSLVAEEVFVRCGGVGAARADRLGVEFGSVGAALTGQVKVSQGMAGTVVAREATLEQSLVRTVVAQRVTVNRPTGVLVMIAQHVSGDVRPLLDWRGALVAGAAFGLVTALVRAIRGKP